jgi:hypothetical protein
MDKIDTYNFNILFNIIPLITTYTCIKYTIIDIGI